MPYAELLSKSSQTHELLSLNIALFRERRANGTDAHTVILTLTVPNLLSWIRRLAAARLANSN